MRHQELKVHGGKLTGGEVTDSVSMQYSCFLLHFQVVLVHLSSFKHHGQQQIHETGFKLKQKQGTWVFLFHTQSLGPLNYDRAFVSTLKQLDHHL